MPIEIINNTRLRYYSAHSHRGFSVTDYIKYYVQVTYLLSLEYLSLQQFRYYFPISSMMKF
jgi:hypothetical protein